MKPTIKVSIGGQAFSLDEDAYSILNNYLQLLKKHFESNPEADEIIADIESRMSELLQMRLNNTQNSVSIEDAQEIINIMGNPKDFDDEAEGNVDGDKKQTDSKNEHADATNTKESGLIKKRLYRDTDHKVIGGVCSGLGHYFRIDPVAVRILFVLIAILPNLIVDKSAMIVILSYIVLWIVMPKAVTLTQKLAMTGSDPSIENIDDRALSTSKKYKGSFLPDVVRVLFNIIIGFIAIITGLVLISMIITLMWLYFDTEIINVNNYLGLLGYNTLNVKIAISIIVLLPSIGLLSLMIMILRRSPFKGRSLVSFLIGLTIWLAAIFYLGSKGVAFANRHKEQATASENITLSTTSDTLHIRLGNEYDDAIPQPNNGYFLYKSEKGKNNKMCILPEVSIKEDSLATNFSIEIRKQSFGQNHFTANKNAERMKLNYVVKDSLFTISPPWYDNENPWKIENFRVIITTPAKKTVIVHEPLDNFYNIHSFTVGGYDNRAVFDYHNSFD